MVENKLVKQQSSLTPSISVGQPRPLLAKVQEDYLQIRRDSSQNLQNTINYILILLNVKPPDTNEDRAYRDTQMLVLCDFITDKFGELTSEEIKQAFKMYVAREFKGVKVFKILDAVCLGEVLNAYVNYRDEHLHIYYSKRIAKRQEVLPVAKGTDEIQQIMDSAIVRCYEEYKTTGEVNEPYNHIFKEMVSRGFLPPLHTESEKQKKWYAGLRKQAQEQVEKEIQAELYSPIGAQSRTLLQQLMTDVKESKHEKVELRLYKIVLEGYFKHYDLVLEDDMVCFKKKV
ncbi:hypothetical protein [Myroides odoratimimus]|uniref:hypothetical protein n=1 Tax=Myroides odoratimimus TaxID=76832 RepID=UPI0025766E38|nr:hypothetical protein [Myroides odoratimimus]MDM1093406.1 hypothetical protein [Myroides odoratimimus]